MNFSWNTGFLPPSEREQNRSTQNQNENQNKIRIATCAGSGSELGAAIFDTNIGILP